MVIPCGCTDTPIRIILNVDVEGLIILRLDPVILKGRIVLNVDVDGLDPVIPKGRINQDFGTNHP